MSSSSSSPPSSSSSIIYSIPGVRQLQIKLNQLTSYFPPPPPNKDDDNKHHQLKILLVHAHPDPIHSFSAAIANQVELAAKEAGHEIRRISLYNDVDDVGGYSPKLTRNEHRLQHALGENIDERLHLTKDVKDHLRMMLWCNTLIFVYPTWWMNTPAAVKGFLDRTLVHDIAFSIPRIAVADDDQEQQTTAGPLIPKMTNITQIVGVSTYGAPYSVVTFAGDNGRRMIAHAVRPVLSPSATVTWLGLYDIDHTTQEQRTEFLQKKVHEMIKNL